ncbi:hypothetical protein MM236_02440 [Belliella sp. DSM 107340]|uniref:Uncharacterized protein n=1 Tax=Belliella calami TaxID=2923436 RepID=A0ABS9UJQ4_9BACT|nr:hypothetical protein [Belliella calami]MCH7396822.1 hypothetical protein [Belliella calami]
MKNSILALLLVFVLLGVQGLYADTFEDNFQFFAEINHTSIAASEQGEISLHFTDGICPTSSTFSLGKEKSSESKFAVLQLIFNQHFTQSYGEEFGFLVRLSSLGILDFLYPYFFFF